MAKIAKPKKRETSVHSRAFRRNATPPPEVPAAKKDKSEDKEHWMYNAQNAGVHKKTKSKKTATRQQHARHAKALERADRNAEVLENKIAKSKVKGKKIVARAKDWDELNEELTASKPKEQPAVVGDTTAATMEVTEEDDDVENMEPAHMEKAQTPPAAAPTTATEPIDIIT